MFPLQLAGDRDREASSTRSTRVGLRVRITSEFQLFLCAFLQSSQRLVDFRVLYTITTGLADSLVLLRV